MSEDNLENFFRKRADDSQFRYREADWDKLEVKLNAAIPVIPWTTKARWMVFGAVLMGAFWLTYWGSTVYFNSGNSNNAMLDISINKTEQSPPPQGSLEDKTNIIKPEDTNSQNTLGDSNEAKGLTNDNQEIADIQDEKQDYDQIAQNRVSTNEQVIIDQNLYDGTGRPGTKLLVIENHELSVKDISVKRVDYSFYPYTMPPLNLSYREIEQTYFPELKHTFSYGFIGAIDFSGTQESGLGKPKVRLGVNTEYFLLPQLSIGIGVNITDKTYDAKGSEYSPPGGYWSYGVVPETTSAECLILDIPVTLSFYQSIDTRSGLTLQAGASSWFMLKEKYYYEYEDPNPSLVSNWYGTNENRYFFGVINLSLGYTYNVNNKWTILAGPYINFPLTGVGHGKVDLQSLGFKTAIRFNQYKLK